MLLSSRHSHNILLSSESDADKEVLSCRWKQPPFRPPSTIITSASPHSHTHRHYYLADFRVKHNSFARASASSGRARERGALLLYVRLTLFQAWKRVRPLSVSQFTVSHYGLSWLKESVYRVVTRPQLPNSMRQRACVRGMYHATACSVVFRRTTVPGSNPYTGTKNDESREPNPSNS